MSRNDLQLAERSPPPYSPPLHPPPPYQSTEHITTAEIHTEDVLMIEPAARNPQVPRPEATFTENFFSTHQTPSTVLQGARLDRGGCTIGVIPAKGYDVGDPEGNEYNRSMLEQMSRWQIEGRWWRYGLFGIDTHYKCFNNAALCCLCWSCFALCFPCTWQIIGSGLKYAKRHHRSERYCEDVHELLELTSDYQRSGWKYKVVPEIPIDWSARDVYEAFEDESKMTKIFSTIVAQRYLLVSFRSYRPLLSDPKQMTTAPGGHWARGDIPGDTLVKLRFSYSWVIKAKFSGSAHQPSRLGGDFDLKQLDVEAQKIDHGLDSAAHAVSRARGVLLMKEREVMNGLRESGFIGIALMIWPPAEEPV